MKKLFLTTILLAAALYTGARQPHRPQTPHPPYPYVTQDVTFASSDSTVLSGTVSLPEGARTAVIFVSGTGAQNRDEEIFGHRPFAVLADTLARSGIASLRYDDRGFGQSGGDFASSTTRIFAQDAAAAVNALRSLGNFDRVGVIGHSEGGTIGFMLGADGTADFVVSLAGMAVSGRETMLAQNLRALQKARLDSALIAPTMQGIAMMMDSIAARYATGDYSTINIAAALDSAGITLPVMLRANLVQQASRPQKQIAALVALDPSEELQKINVPLLALNGTLDTQVDAQVNLARIKELCPAAQTLALPGLNHLMQPAVTGDVSEYARIPLTVDVSAITAILSFIQSLENLP